MKKATTTVKQSKSAPNERKGAPSPSQLIDASIAALGDWRGATLARVWPWRPLPVRFDLAP